jgi:cysteine desulfurase
MSLTLPIFLDNSSTTKIDPRVVEVMLPYLTEIYGNPASRSHSFGWQAEEAVERARSQIAEVVGCDIKELVFTSGATEATNLALKGASSFYAERGRHLITIKTEHKATLDSMRDLERLGFRVTFLDVEANGLVDLEKLKDAIEKDTILISISFVNNEIGVIQDIKSIGEICKSKGLLLHVDAAQAVGKIDFNLNDLNVDLMSFSAHKVYGPKGIGALYVRRKPRVRLVPQMHGGGHERGFRSGTLATHQIVGMGEAFKLAKSEMPIEIERIRTLRNILLKNLQEMEEVYINGDLDQRIVHNLNVSFNFVEGESLMMAIKDIAVSSGSACTSASLEPSYVLRAIGRNDELAHSSIRFTIGRFNTEDEINYTVKLVKEKVAKLRELSPLWEMHKEGIDLNNYKWQAHGERDVILHG